MEKILEGNAIVIKLTDDLIAANVKGFNLNIMDMLSEDDDHELLSLDLAAVENIDSVGVTFVIGLYKATKREGRQFKVTGCSQDIIRLFKLMKLDEFFDMKE